MATDRCVRWKKESSDFWTNAADNSVMLTAVISYGCKSQSNEGFEELINSLNSEPIRRKIKHVDVVDTSYLYRHTIPEFASYADTSIVTKWQQINQPFLDKLKIDHTLIPWKPGLDHPEFQKWLKQMMVDFAGDENGNGVIAEFRASVLSEAEKFVIKGMGTFVACVKFILEECAYTCLHFKNVVMAYPTQLSHPISVAIKYYGTNVTHLPYSMSNNAQRHQHRSLDRNEINYEIIEFITKVASTVNFFVINKNGQILYKNESLGKIVSENDATSLNSETWKNSIEVMKTNHPILVEEIDKGKNFLSVKSPLTVNGEVEGVIGLSVDITAERQIDAEKRKAKELEFLNKIQQIKIEFQDEFTQFISRMAHDIMSPLASLKIFSENCSNLTSNQKHSLDSIISNIKSIANDLLHKYKYNKRELNYFKEQYLPVVAALQNAIDQKKMQYANHSDVSINLSCAPSAKYSFIKADQSSFTRMISNLINNAIEACKENKQGIIDVSLEVDGSNVAVKISDNGKGMDPGDVDKILHDVAVESSKSGGYGLGLKQVLDTVRLYHGKIQVNSGENNGTTFVVSFPLSKQPDWISTEINLSKNCTVVVLDKDKAVHDIWKKRLKECSDGIVLKFFESSDDATDFIDSLPSDEKDNVYAFMDYELKDGDPSDGLMTMLQCGLIKRSTVVTDMYNDEQLQELVRASKIKMIPKQFLENIQITA